MTQNSTNTQPDRRGVRFILSAALAVFLRDCLSETRQWHALNSIVMLGLIALTSVSVGLQGVPVRDSAEAAGLFWTVQFFTAMSALARSFVREEDAGTVTALRLSAPPAAVYLGKLCFNFLLMMIQSLLLVPGFLLLINRPTSSILLLTVVTVVAGLSLAATTTILGAMAARAGARSSLFAVMGFPLLLPVIVPAMHATAVAFGRVDTAGGDLRWIISYGIMCIVAALMLFPTIWAI